MAQVCEHCHVVLNLTARRCFFQGVPCVAQKGSNEGWSIRMPIRSTWFFLCFLSLGCPFNRSGQVLLKILKSRNKHNGTHEPFL